jgi:hypothetical protein
MIQKLDGTFRLSVQEVLSKPEEEVDPTNTTRVYSLYLAYKDFAQRALRLELQRKTPN